MFTGWKLNMITKMGKAWLLKGGKDDCCKNKGNGYSMGEIIKAWANETLPNDHKKNYLMGKDMVIFRDYVYTVAISSAN